MFDWSLLQGVAPGAEEVLELLAWAMNESRAELFPNQPLGWALAPLASEDVAVAAAAVVTMVVAAGGV